MFRAGRKRLPLVLFDFARRITPRGKRKEEVEIGGGEHRKDTTLQRIYEQRHTTGVEHAFSLV